MDVELRGVDDFGKGAEGTQVAAFRFERGLDGRIRAQRVRTASLAEAPHENGIGGLEEDDLGRNRTPNRFQNDRQLLQRGTFAHVHDQGGAAKLARLHGQVGKLGNEFNRQVVDAVVAQILEGLQNGGLTRTTHAGNDDQFRRMGLARFLRGSLRAFPRLASRLSGRHQLDSSIDAPAVGRQF